MKKYFAKAFLGLCALGTSTVAFAQDAAAPAVETGLYQALKVKFIEGGADFMSSIAIVLIFFNRNRIDLRFGIRIGKNYLFELG